MSGSSAEKYPQLLSLAVHELRTPASVVGGYLRMIQRDLDEPLTVRQRKMLDEAEKSCGRLVALIAEMSDIGKLDSGLITLARQPLDLFSVLSEVAAHVHEARDRDVQFELRGEGSALVIGDVARLRAAFDAVFRAILRERVGPATVVAERRLAAVDGRRSAVVIVADAAGVQEAYERPRGVFNERRGGLGLALPLARRVFEGHGGRIWSPAPNAPESPETSGGHDPLARASAIVALPLTE